MYCKGEYDMNENNDNEVQSNQSVVENNGSTFTYYLFPIALIFCGAIFKALSLIIKMVNDAGGEVVGISVAIKIMDILPYIAWGLIIPSLIIAIIKTIKAKKKN